MLVFLSFTGGLEVAVRGDEEAPEGATEGLSLQGAGAQATVMLKRQVGVWGPIRARSKHRQAESRRIKVCKKDGLKPGELEPKPENRTRVRGPEA